MTDETILVTGATGKTGRRVARILDERGVAVRAACRSSLVRFDWADRATWAPALEGAGAVYLVAPHLGSAEAADDIAALARVGAAAGVRRAVLLSVPQLGGSGRETVLAAERSLGEAGLESTVLRVRWFFQNFSEDFLLDLVLGGELRLPAGDGEEAFVDAGDIAEVAAEIARATGRRVGYVPLTTEAYAHEQRDKDVPEEWIQISVDLYADIRSGGLSTLTDGVEHVLGRPPRDFADYARTTAAQGAWAV